MSIYNVFSSLSDDIIHKIFQYLKDDPRHWPRLASVSTRFSSLILHSCSTNNCSHTLPSDLISAATATVSLHKLTVCCPGLLHAGILLNDTSDFGLHRDLGPDQPLTVIQSHNSNHNSNDVVSVAATISSETKESWSLFDDLYYDTVYNPSEECEPQEYNSVQNDAVSECVVAVAETNGCNKRSGSQGSHLASGVWNLSREQGGKLLGRQFRDDALYVCDWPGCVHVEEKRKYMVFRGVFKDFKRTRVWRTINDGKRKKVNLGCAFCSCDETWDLHSAFCLRRGFGYHGDGEPVVRAFVCENGHVSGAWTDVPMYG
ncbi:hypothetical protein TanjilG_14527 [Lupinus angustifolius]|uniref:F-box domain-containing protein n=1 Tax=Lupinus angustifolius TaxID=3871 RepID=A0A1J7G4G9_LUPAN|nr:PREDICTED: phytochrome A-associated F-box protein-like [Lupinus angustifolius]XP_019419604.1 PREDICTED: phytochrome A-associated F-box protein-like [Lupinus angustifolius]OIV95373.1 hypothetical protein TanjilG_14527 [Lupinus angustifolius]